MTETTDPSEPAGEQPTAFWRQWNRIEILLVRVRRKFPYLVWYNDEIDVTVTLMEDKMDPEDPFRTFFSGGFRDIQNQMHQMGISFDSGQGCYGRDWEWDWSLKGPISVRFRSRAQRPHLRLERPKPALVISNA